MLQRLQTLTHKVTRRAQELKDDTQGLTTVEYIIVLCLIVVVGFAVWQAFGEEVANKVQEVDENIIGALPTGGEGA